MRNVACESERYLVPPLTLTLSREGRGEREKMALFSLPPSPLELSLSHISEFNPQPGVENPDGDLEERFQARGERGKDGTFFSSSLSP